MTMFQAIDTAMSGATVARISMDATADNVANVNTIYPADEEPFRARLVLAEAVRGNDGTRKGARVMGIGLSELEPLLVYDPGHPFADETGMVRRPAVDLSVEMTNLIMANRTYQANLSVIDRVRDSYQSALRIGQR